MEHKFRRVPTDRKLGAGRGWYSLLNLGNDNFAKSGAAANPAFGNSLAAQLKR